MTADINESPSVLPEPIELDTPLIDMDFTAKAEESYSINVKYFKVKINGDVVGESFDGNLPEDIELHNGDQVKICKVIKKRESRPAQIIFNGFTKDDVVSNNDPEEEQYTEEIIVKE